MKADAKDCFDNLIPDRSKFLTFSTNDIKEFNNRLVITSDSLQQPLVCYSYVITFYKNGELNKVVSIGLNGNRIEIGDKYYHINPDSLNKLMKSLKSEPLVKVSFNDLNKYENFKEKCSRLKNVFISSSPDNKFTGFDGKINLTLEVPNVDYGYDPDQTTSMNLAKLEKLLYSYVTEQTGLTSVLIHINMYAEPFSEVSLVEFDIYGLNENKKTIKDTFNSQWINTLTYDLNVWGLSQTEVDKIK